MQQKHVKRLVCITSVGLHKNPKAPFYYNALLQSLLSNKYEDMQNMEQVVHESGLDWTIMRPVRLVNGEKLGEYELAINSDLQVTSSISRADVAGFMLKDLDQAEYINNAVEIIY